MSDPLTKAFEPLHELIEAGGIDPERTLPHVAAFVADLIDLGRSERQRMVLNARFDEALLRLVHQNELRRRQKDGAF